MNFIPAAGVSIYQIDVIGGGGSGSKGTYNQNQAIGGGGGGSGLYIRYVPDDPITGPINIVYIGQKGVKGPGTSTRIQTFDSQTTLEAGGGYSNYGLTGNINGANGGDQFITNNLSGKITIMTSSGGGGGSNTGIGGIGYDGHNNGESASTTQGGNGGGITNISNHNGIGGTSYASQYYQDFLAGGGGGILPTVSKDTRRSQGRDNSSGNVATGLNYGSGGGGGYTQFNANEPGDGAPGAVILYYHKS
jgi:hypothetical protein